MFAASHIITPNDSEENILIQNQYKVKYLSDYITIIVGKTKNNIILRNNYYELKVNSENLSLLTKIVFKSIDESYEFITNIFNQNKFLIKDINSKMITIIIIIYDNIKGKERKIELSLKENFDNKNYLIKELFNKYMKLEKEMIEEKNNNFMLKQENYNIKMEIESIKNFRNNDIGEIKMNVMNITNQICQLQQQLNQLIFQINQIQQQLNSINNNNNIMNQNNNFNFINSNNFNKMTNDFNLMNLNNNNLINQDKSNNYLVNDINKYNPFFSQKNSQDIHNHFPNPYLNEMLMKNNSNIFYEKESEKDVFFRLSIIKKDENFPIIIKFKDNDRMSTLIEKLKNDIRFYPYKEEKMIFIYKAKKLNMNLTASEAGLTNCSTIFVVPVSIKISFKIERLNAHALIVNGHNIYSKVSVIINEYLEKSGLNKDDIISFSLKSNSKLNLVFTNADNTLKEEGIKKDSVIYVKTKNNLKLKTISIFVKHYDGYSKEYKYPSKMECLITEKIKALIEAYKDMNEITFGNAFLKPIELDEDKRIEETELSSNSTIIITKEIEIKNNSIKKDSNSQDESHNSLDDYEVEEIE